MVLGMDMTFSKTTAHKSGETPDGRYAQNPRWPPLKTERAKRRILLCGEPALHAGREHSGLVGWSRET